MICLVDRLQDDGADNIRKHCKNYVALFDMNDFPEAKRGTVQQDGPSVRAVAVHA